MIITNVYQELERPSNATMYARTKKEKGRWWRMIEKQKEYLLDLIKPSKSKRVKIECIICKKIVRNPRISQVTCLKEKCQKARVVFYRHKPEVKLRKREYMKKYNKKKRMETQKNDILPNKSP